MAAPIFERLETETPNQKQIQFFKSTKRHIAYGGARGGGKSWAMRRKFVMLAMRYPGLKLLLLRRTLPELRENHQLPLQEELNGYAKYKSDEKAFVFPNGSRIRLGYCDSESDVYQYQGQEYDVIGLEEATHFTETQKDFFITANRSTRDDFTPRMYYTSNPGNVGHAWFKRLFVDRDFRGAENPDDYEFIQATVFDNKVLMEKNPEYVENLKALPEGMRRAHLYGEWNLLEGRYFTEFNPEIHVMRPFSIPDSWKRYVTIDYGLDMFASYWIAVDYNGFAYVYREVYQKGMIISDAARELRLNTFDERIEHYIAPPDLWNRRQDSGKSAAELFWDCGVYLIKANNDRVQGWYNLHEWLKPCEDEEGKPAAKLRIFQNCPNLIESIPQLQFDKKNPNDCADEPHQFTHGPDAIRYFVASRPSLPTVTKREKRERYEGFYGKRKEKGNSLGYGMEVQIV